MQAWGMTLLEAIDRFDGRHVGALRAGLAGPVDAAALMNAAEDPGRAVAATWAIKALAEAGRAADLDAARIFGGLLRDLPHEAHLHLLQTMRHLPCPSALDAVRPFLSHKRPLLRAWALDAAYLLSGDRHLLQDAYQDSAASVRARARNLDPGGTNPHIPPEP